MINPAEALFPSFCYGCKTTKTYFCEDCREAADSFGYALCPHCKIRLPKGKLTQKECRYHLRLKRIFSCSPYNDKLIQKLLKDLKYGRAHKLSANLAKYAHWWLQKNEYLHEIKNNVDFIVPVPMHKRKQKERGFNHAQYIADEISTLISVPAENNLLVKKKKTKPQAETENKKERVKNLKNAFYVTERCREKTKDAKILLIDDVVTTGSTLRECAVTLKKVGAKEVWALTIAQD